MSKIKLTGSNSGYVEIDSAADAGNLTLTLPTSGVRLLSNTDNVFSGITTTAELDINGKIDVSTDIVGGRNLKVTGITTLSDDLTLTGASYNVLWDKSDNQLEFGDNAKLSFGASSDLQLYHDGSSSYVDHGGIGNLLIRGNNTNAIALKAVQSKNSLICHANLQVQLYYNNSLKFETTNTGAKITGICTATSFSGSGEGLTRTTQLSHRNIIINGAMLVAQRGTSFSQVANNEITVDRFGLIHPYSTHMNVSHSTDAPDGFSKSFKLGVDVTDASIGTGQYVVIRHKIEAQNLQQLGFGTSGAKSISLSFYVKSNKTGTFSVNIQQTDNSDKQVSAPFTINSANTWERKTFTFAGDTSGVINDDNGTGLTILWWLSAGSTYNSGTSRSTFTAHADADSGAGCNVNILDSTSNNFYLTGVQLEVGEQATPFEHRSYGEELSRCHRYFYKMPMNPNDANHGAHPAYQYHPSYKMIVNDYPVVMRAVPTATFTIGNPNVASSFNVFNISEKQFKAYKSSGYNASESFYLRSFEVTAEL